LQGGNPLQEARNLLVWNPGPADGPDTPLDFLQLPGQASVTRYQAVFFNMFFFDMFDIWLCHQICLIMLGGFGWIWDTLGVANNILERRNRRKIEVGSMSQSADTFSQSIFMVDNALGTSVSGPLPEGIEERCPKSWPWTKFCHESVYY